MSERHEAPVPGAEGAPSACSSCGRSLAERRAIELQGGRWKCLRCSFVDVPLAARSGRVALVVGTILIALNQGDQLLGGSFPWASSWYKIPLTYAVPFCVATYGALSNGYRGALGRPGA